MGYNARRKLLRREKTKKPEPRACLDNRLCDVPGKPVWFRQSF
jgi:hypothetical protein